MITYKAFYDDVEWVSCVTWMLLVEASGTRIERIKVGAYWKLMRRTGTEEGQAMKVKERQFRGKEGHEQRAMLFYLSWWQVTEKTKHLVRHCTSEWKIKSCLKKRGSMSLGKWWARIIETCNFILCCMESEWVSSVPLPLMWGFYGYFSDFQGVNMMKMSSDWVNRLPPPFKFTHSLLSSDGWAVKDTYIDDRIWVDDWAIARRRKEKKERERVSPFIGPFFLSSFSAHTTKIDAALPHQGQVLLHATAVTQFNVDFLSLFLSLV